MESYRVELDTNYYFRKIKQAKSLKELNDFVMDKGNMFTHEQAKYMIWALLDTIETLEQHEESMKWFQHYMDCYKEIEEKIQETNKEVNYGRF